MSIDPTNERPDYIAFGGDQAMPRSQPFTVSAWPDDLDVAVVLALFMADDPSADANPVIGLARPAEFHAAVALAMIAGYLSMLTARAAGQVVALVGATEHDAAEPVRSIARRMSDLDQRRMVLLEFASSLASPLQLGPPEEFVSQLVEYAHGAT